MPQPPLNTVLGGAKRIFHIIGGGILVCGVSYLIYPIGFSLMQKEPNTLVEGFNLVSEITSTATTLHAIKSELDKRSIAYDTIGTADCSTIYMEPAFECKGGPALFVTLNLRVITFNPLYQPTLNTFMAFDEKNMLEYATTTFMGGS